MTSKQIGQLQKYIRNKNTKQVTRLLKNKKIKQYIIAAFGGGDPLYDEITIGIRNLMSDDPTFGKFVILEIVPSLDFYSNDMIIQNYLLEQLFKQTESKNIDKRSATFLVKSAENVFEMLKYTYGEEEGPARIHPYDLEKFYQILVGIKNKRGRKPRDFAKLVARFKEMVKNTTKEKVEARLRLVPHFEPIFPKPQYTADWQILCNQLTTVGIETLREIAKSDGIDVRSIKRKSKKSLQKEKRLLCAELAKSMVGDRKKEALYKHPCQNDESFLGDDFSQLPAKDILFEKFDNVTFCFTMEEAEGFKTSNTKKNPYNNQSFSKNFWKQYEKKKKAKKAEFDKPSEDIHMLKKRYVTIKDEINEKLDKLSDAYAYFPQTKMFNISEENLLDLVDDLNLASYTKKRIEKILEEKGRLEALDYFLDDLVRLTYADDREELTLTMYKIDDFFEYDSNESGENNNVQQIINAIEIIADYHPSIRDYEDQIVQMSKQKLQKLLNYLRFNSNYLNSQPYNYQYFSNKLSSGVNHTEILDQLLNIMIDNNSTELEGVGQILVSFMGYEKNLLYDDFDKIEEKHAELGKHEKAIVNMTKDQFANLIQQLKEKDYLETTDYSTAQQKVDNDDVISALQYVISRLVYDALNTTAPFSLKDIGKFLVDFIKENSLDLDNS